jgi:hypothetical protein
VNAVTIAIAIGLARPCDSEKTLTSDSPITIEIAATDAQVRDPIHPSDDEPGVITEHAAREDVLPTTPRHHRSELGQRVRAEQRVQSANQPDAEKGRNAGQKAGDFARSPEDPAANRVADGDGEAERQTEDLEEAVVRLGDSATRRLGGGTTRRVLLARHAHSMPLKRAQG